MVVHMCHVFADAGYTGGAVKKIFASPCFTYTTPVAVECLLGLVVFVADTLSAEVESKDNIAANVFAKFFRGLHS